MAKTAENPSENDHGDEENDRIPISIVAEATSDFEWHPTEETALLPPKAMFGDDYVSSHDGALSDVEHALFGGGSLIAFHVLLLYFPRKKGTLLDCTLAYARLQASRPTVGFVCLSFGRVLIAEVVIQVLTCRLLQTIAADNDDDAELSVLSVRTQRISQKSEDGVSKGDIMVKGLHSALDPAGVNTPVDNLAHHGYLEILPNNEIQFDCECPSPALCLPAEGQRQCLPQVCL